MQDFLVVTGMVIKGSPISEYDRRITILTKERGKISCFAKGARKPNSPYVAATNPFSFGEFKLYVGKSSYNLLEANISYYFEELRHDYMSAYLGMYFLEVMDYFTRENNDEIEMLKLLFQSLRAISAKGLTNELTRAIFEIKVLVVNGEFPGIEDGMILSDGARYAIGYIESAPIEKLYSFSISSSVLKELQLFAKIYRNKYYSHDFKSLEILENIV